MAKQKKSTKAKPKTVKKKTVTPKAKFAEVAKSNKTVARELAIKHVLDSAAKNRKLNEEKKNNREKKKVVAPSEPTHLELNGEMKHKNFPEFLRANFEDQDLKING